MMVTTIRDVTLSNASKQWPTTHFDVVSSQIMRATGSSGGNYHAYLELGYQVEGQAYRLDCNNFNIPIHNSVEDAEDYIRKVAAGEFGKDVHYNPENPSLAFVKPGIKPQHVFAIIIALGLIGVPITIMFLQ
ncbi:DUF3592 domain-containing protein [Aurantivibrio plasticivorans]